MQPVKVVQFNFTPETEDSYATMHVMYDDGQVWEKIYRGKNPKWERIDLPLDGDGEAEITDEEIVAKINAIREREVGNE